MSDFNFDHQELLHHQLMQCLGGQGERFVYLWGVSGCGKSHLLQASCQYQENKKAFYCPLSSMKPFGPEALEGLEHHDLLCLDELDVIAGIAEWEEALFHLYNRIRDQSDGVLMMSGRSSPAATPITLPDLRSRLAWGLVLQLHELDEDGKIKVLQNRSQQRGFVINDASATYIMNHVGRDMHQLTTLLERLDEASLAQRRKITIPFIKEVLNT